MGQAARYSVQERINIVDAYFVMKSVVQTQQQFRRNFPCRNAPTRLATKRLLDYNNSGRREVQRITLNAAAAGQSGQKITCECETMFGAVSKEIHKTFFPVDTSFKKFSCAHNAPGSSHVSV